MERGTGLIPENEERRRAAVCRYEVLDTPPDGAFDRITKLAAQHFGVPVSIVSIVDSDRIWFKSRHGVEVDEIGRDPGLCASAILGDEPWVVEDAAVDPRAMANPLVAGEMGLRFYAGAPLRTQDGFNLGTLCVIDRQPREFSARDAEVLADLADVVVDELELRLAARKTVSQELMLREQAERLARDLQASLLPFELPELDGAEAAALYLPADAGVVGGDFFDAFIVGDKCVLAVGDVSGKGSRAAAVTGLTRHTIRSAALWAASPAEVLANLNRAMLLDRRCNEVEHYCTVLLAFARRSGDGFRLTVASAGHPPALIVHREGTCAHVAAAGPPAGWYAEAAYGEVRAELRHGERLVMYTDGLTEARTADGFLGITGLERLVAHATGAQATIDSLRAPIESGDVSVGDDVAALVLRPTT